MFDSSCSRLSACQSMLMPGAVQYQRRVRHAHRECMGNLMVRTVHPAALIALASAQ
jgi:hypothetical protein